MWSITNTGGVVNGMANGMAKHTHAVVSISTVGTLHASRAGRQWYLGPCGPALELPHQGVENGRDVWQHQARAGSDEDAQQQGALLALLAVWRVLDVCGSEVYGWLGDVLAAKPSYIHVYICMYRYTLFAATPLKQYFAVLVDTYISPERHSHRFVHNSSNTTLSVIVSFTYHCWSPPPHKSGPQNKPESSCMRWRRSAGMTWAGLVSDSRPVNCTAMLRTLTSSSLSATNKHCKLEGRRVGMHCTWLRCANHQVVDHSQPQSTTVNCQPSYSKPLPASHLSTCTRC